MMQDFPPFKPDPNRSKITSPTCPSLLIYCGYISEKRIWFTWFIVLNATFSNISATLYIMATSFSGERSRSTRR